MKKVGIFLGILIGSFIFLIVPLGCLLVTFQFHEHVDQIFWATLIVSVILVLIVFKDLFT